MNRLTFDPEEDQWKFQPLVPAEMLVLSIIFPCSTFVFFLAGSLSTVTLMMLSSVCCCCCCIFTVFYLSFIAISLSTQQIVPDEEEADVCSRIQTSHQPVCQGCHSDGRALQIQGRCAHARASQDGYREAAGDKEHRARSKRLLCFCVSGRERHASRAGHDSSKRRLTGLLSRSGAQPKPLCGRLAHQGQRRPQVSLLVSLSVKRKRFRVSASLNGIIVD